MTFSFDTNILVYAVDRSAPERQAAAGRLLEAAAGLDAFLTEQSLVEFVHVATRKARQPLVDVAQIVQAWLGVFQLLIPVPATITEMLDFLSRYRLSVWDARLIAVCAANGCNVLFSEDLQDNAVYGGVRVLNPFNPDNASIVSVLLGS